MERTVCGDSRRSLSKASWSPAWAARIRSASSEAAAMLALTVPTEKDIAAARNASPIPSCAKTHVERKGHAPQVSTYHELKERCCVCGFSAQNLPGQAGRDREPAMGRASGI